MFDENIKYIPAFNFIINYNKEYKVFKMLQYTYK